MVHIAAGGHNNLWFGVAWSQNDIVATTVRSNRADALSRVKICIPDGTATLVVDDPTPFVCEVVSMLEELEGGNEEHKRYSISKEYFSVPMYRIYTAAAAIPIGYVTTYGNIANAAGSEARAVGRAMATNPLYPIVPCHRVVGADMSLVGYGGKQDQEALKAKLSRIAAEARGADGEEEIDTQNGNFTIYPAERVISAVEETERRRIEAEKRDSARAAADQMQLRLF